MFNYVTSNPRNNTAITLKQRCGLYGGEHCAGGYSDAKESQIPGAQSVQDTDRLAGCQAMRLMSNLGSMVFVTLIVPLGVGFGPSNTISTSKPVSASRAST